jgi:hypothetical protein
MRNVYSTKKRLVGDLLLVFWGNIFKFQVPVILNYWNVNDANVLFCFTSSQMMNLKNLMFRDRRNVNIY